MIHWVWREGGGGGLSGNSCDNLPPLCSSTPSHFRPHTGRGSWWGRAWRRLSRFCLNKCKISVPNTQFFTSALRQIKWSGSENRSECRNCVRWLAPYHTIITVISLGEILKITFTNKQWTVNKCLTFKHTEAKLINFLHTSLVSVLFQIQEILWSALGASISILLCHIVTVTGSCNDDQLLPRTLDRVLEVVRS